VELTKTEITKGNYFNQNIYFVKLKIKTYKLLYKNEQFKHKIKSKIT